MAALKTRAIIFFFIEPKVGARNFLVTDFTLLYFGVRKEEDNHRVDLRTGRSFRTLCPHTLISHIGKLRPKRTT